MNYESQIWFNKIWEENEKNVCVKYHYLRNISNKEEIDFDVVMESGRKLQILVVLLKKLLLICMISKLLSDKPVKMYGRLWCLKYSIN